MEIRNIFEKNINRPINGVIKVDQKDTDVIEQELDEYVITDELRKHFKEFFKYYCQAYDNPTADMGVWISGFFGSGKSHFLKMLSYLLSDMEVNGKRTSQRFIEKLKDVPELQEELTPREREVAELAAKGLRNSEIAETLCISENTVKHHLKIAFQKMNIDRRSKLIDMLR